jgi:hypothetical protein
MNEQDWPMGDPNPVAKVSSFSDVVIAVIFTWIIGSLFVFSLGYGAWRLIRGDQ